MADKIECYIIRQGDLNRDEAVADFCPCRIDGGEQLPGFVGNNNEVEWLKINKFDNFLELRETLAVIFEIVGKLVPDKYNFFVVLVDYVRQPSYKSVRVNIQSGDTFLIR